MDSEEGRSARGSPRTLVLLVEDYDDTRQMYAVMLRDAGFRVAEASDGEEAIDKARTLQPAVIVMDLSLPRLDGWEATRRLKANQQTTTIPIVALSGHTPARYVELARQAGCDVFLPKPCPPWDLVACLNRVLNHPSVMTGQ